nr:putative zinc finger, CCHC-type [Tanacetum cinerariifolium]
MTERTIRPVVHDDFITYLNEDEYDLHKVEYPIFYNEAINSNQTTQWLEAMNNELKSMILGLSQRAYIDKILKKYNMQNCSPIVTHVVKGDKFGAYECPKNKLEQKEMRLKPYAFVVGSLTYAQVCTHPVAYITGTLRRYQSNPGKEHWKAAKKIFKNTSSTGAGLYLETKFIYVREKAEDNNIAMEYIITHDMLVDLLTKSLQSNLFLEHVAGMGLCDSKIVTPPDGAWTKYMSEGVTL